MKECGIHICIEWNQIPPPFQFRKTSSIFSFFFREKKHHPTIETFFKIVSAGREDISSTSKKKCS